MRLLLISYYFPPCGGAAVQRWLKWLPELVEKGFEVTVLTTLNGDYPIRDESLLGEIPSEVEILRVPTPSVSRIWKMIFGSGTRLPYGDLSSTKKDNILRRMLIWIRLNLVIPDMRRIWNPGAYKAAIQHLRKKPTDILITTGPPHSTHLLGLKLKNRFKITWVADWRDPWTGIYYFQLNPPSAPSMSLHKKLERKVAMNSDLNTVVSQHLANQLPGKHNVVIHNGFDAQKFTLIQSEESSRTESFRLKYVGNLTEGQKFQPLIEIIIDALSNEDFCLTFVGTGLTPEQKNYLEDVIPGKYVCKEFVPHDEALREMKDAEVLLLLINYYEGSQGMLTTKLFEYIASGTAILCLAPKTGEAEAMITQYSAGACFEVKKKQAAVDYLRGVHGIWAEGKEIKNKKDVSALSSQNQVLKLIKEFHSLKRS
jgi:glycosyltransferase involved in cell wall biosynthesis